MTDKKTEALKLALEALEVATTPLAKDRQEVLRAQSAIREALAEQPAQQPHCDDCGGFDPECPLAQQQEQVIAWITNGSLYGLRRTNKKTAVIHREETKVARIPVFIKVDA